MKSKQNLAILLLDFEKAYDKVDWAFLEGTMSCMGFSSNWITAVSALYRNGSSKVTLAGGKGESFILSRSVGQGRPMAPYLFIFLAEVMSSYLSDVVVGIQGLRIPHSMEELLDTEFADHTSLYVQGTETNLRMVEKALEVFCLGSGAKINWSKTIAFWVSELPLPSWMPHPEFRWIPEGTAIRYLGCQIGIKIAPELQIAPLL